MPKQKQTPTSKTPEAQTPAPEAKPALMRELSDFQLLACNLAGDLLMNGGYRPNVENLLFALVGHEWYLKFKDAPAAEYHSAQVDRWYNRLAKDWPEKREPVDALPGTVSGRLYANIRDDLRERLESFMADARMHELYLLQSVLELCETSSWGATSDRVESVLAEVFMYHLDRTRTYVKIPRNKLDMVEQYARLLGKAA